MKTRRWLSDEQIEAIDAAHRKEKAATDAAWKERRDEVAKIFAAAGEVDLAAGIPSYPVLSSPRSGRRR